MNAKPAPNPVVCSLSAAEAQIQIREWVDLQQLAVRTTALARGAQMVFALEAEPAVRDLAEREASCCAFLDIDMRLVERELVVEITSENDDALPVIKMLSGVAGA